MDLTSVFVQLGIALGLGLLVGLQREHVASPVAGIRTFPLVTVLGTVSALLALEFGGWMVAAGLLGLAAFVVVGNLLMLKKGGADPGQTTEVALLLMYAVGAYLVVGHREAAIALGGGVAVMLQLKGQLRRFTARLGEQDLTAIMRFALIWLVILPVLPNQTYDAYGVLNPRQIWLMVVLIVGLGLAGYIVYKFWGQRAGTLLGGLLGGLISSTATTLASARQVARAPASAATAAAVIQLASTVVFIRVLLEIAVVAPGFLPAAGPRLGGLLLVMAGLSAVLWLRCRNEKAESLEQENPSELKGALLFAGLYALVLVGVAATKEYFGSRGLYAVALFSGMVDMDAITLSTARLVSVGRMDPDLGWKLVVLASLSNLVFKGAAVAAFGHPSLLRRITLPFGLALLAGVLILFL